MADMTIKAGDTEAITYTIDLESEDNLDNVTSAALYARKFGANTNHVDGATVTVSDSANKEVSFDPDSAASDGNDAFAAGDEGRYKVYTRVTWSDGDVTRHPGEGFREWKIESTFE